MEGIKRPLFWVVLLLGSLAFVFHMVGFVSPGWIVVSVKPQPIDFVIRGPESQVGNLLDDVIDSPHPTDKPKPQPNPHQGPQPEHWPHQGPHPRPGPHGGEHPRPSHHYPHHHGGMGQWGEGMGHGRDKRHAADGDARKSDSSEEVDESQNDGHMGADFKDEGMWPMGTRQGMDNMPQNDQMMEDFMERMDLDSEEAEMGPDSDMMSGLSPMFSKQHCGETMKTLASYKPGGRISIKFGLWFSHLCVVNRDDEDDDDDSDSDDSDEHEHGHHKRCHCKTMPSECFFETYDMFGLSSYEEIQSYPHEDRRDLRKRLNEHRVEGTISVVTCLVGLILGAVAFKNGYGRKWFAITGMAAMLFSCILISVPVVRHAKHSCRMSSYSALLSIRPPFAAICSAIGGLLCFITMLVIAAGLFRKKRTDGKWNRFSNGLYDEATQEKKPGLVFLAEALPEKPPLYDISDFSELKPNEEFEPEKKPVE